MLYGKHSTWRDTRIAHMNYLKYYTCDKENWTLPQFMDGGPNFGSLARWLPYPYQQRIATWGKNCYGARAPVAVGPGDKVQSELVQLLQRLLCIFGASLAAGSSTAGLSAPLRAVNAGQPVQQSSWCKKRRWRRSRRSEEEQVGQVKGHQ